MNKDTDPIQLNITERQLLLDLLAIIHGDGGHYTHAHGLVRSTADAREVLNDLKIKLDKAEFDLQKMHHRYDRHADDYIERGYN